MLLSAAQVAPKLNSPILAENGQFIDTLMQIVTSVDEQETLSEMLREHSERLIQLAADPGIVNSCTMISYGDPRSGVHPAGVWESAF